MPSNDASPTGPPSPQSRSLLQELRSHPLWLAAAGLLALALFLAGTTSNLQSIFGGPLWATPPEIHPRDTTDGSSLLLPFVVKTASTFFPISGANFLCRLDLIWAEDSIGQRVAIRNTSLVAGAFDIPAGGLPINVPCDGSRLFQTRANGSLTLGGTDTMFVHRFPSGIFQQVAYFPPWHLLKTCVFIQVSYSAAGGVVRQVTSPVFQWPSVPGGHQWAEGPIVPNAMLPDPGDPGAFYSLGSLAPGPLRCSAEPLQYYGLILPSGQIQLFPTPPPPVQTDQMGSQIMPPYL
jgi:hypothetical protein